MQAMKWIDVAGAALAAEYEATDGASGPSLLFLHANVADRRMWRGQQDALVTRHPVLSYDRRGFGESRTIAATPHSRVADLWAVMDGWQCDRVVLVGCSLGGRVAIDAALAQPDRVSGLVVVTPGVSGALPAQPDGPVKTLMDAIDAASTLGDLEGVKELRARLWLDGPASAPGRVGGETRQLFLAMNDTALRAIDPGPSLEEPSAWERLEQIRVPTLVMWGDLDLPHLQERCKALADRIPGARSAILTGTAHLPALEAPRRFNAALDEFLEGLKPAK
ncbi:UNVERIFIED_ORG: pimeloyl-ACP methyl ester carboxylesterase [Variovorax paradoxus]|nr:pimeloyl-ACP methyl ester carboxylesterase [Variovorax paradoxus]